MRVLDGIPSKPDSLSDANDFSVPNRGSPLWRLSATGRTISRLTSTGRLEAGTEERPNRVVATLNSYNRLNDMAR